MYTSQVIGLLDVFDTTRLATAKVVEDATVVAVEPLVLTFFTA
jgi:hypothetical protein